MSSGAMAGRAWPWRATVLGLAALTLALLVAPPAGSTAGSGVRLLVGALAAGPLIALLLLKDRDPTRWGVWVALTMTPYVALSVGSWLVTPDRRAAGIVFALIASGVFFAGIFTARRPVSR
jgi:hypothetical protein